jgi:GDP-D-mannose 3',5'-epimerase
MVKTIVVFGAGGFIGGNLSKRLYEQGHSVIGVDIEKNKYIDNCFTEFHVCDLRLIDNVRKVISENVDELYQLAADMGGATYISSGIYDADIMTNSVTINTNTLTVCVEKKVKKIFYSSSACVYPEYNQLDPNNPMCSESSVYPAEPDTEYGWEKLFSERLFKAFERQYKLDIRIARFHNIYGPHGTYSGGKEKAPAAVCRKVFLNDSSIDIIGDGEQTRSFLYIDDCLDAIELLMKSDHKDPINIGSEEMVTINTLCKTVTKHAKKNLTFNYIDGPQGVRGRNSDNTIISSVLQWKPKYSLDSGMAITYLWISEQLRKVRAEN